MYSVYKITNLINNKTYIGSSIRVEKRWRQHINAANNKNSSSYNYPLQTDIRQYGVNNFSFEILNQNFSSIEDMEQYEQIKIVEYNSLIPNGYNQTLFTSSHLIAKENLAAYLNKISNKCAKVDINEQILDVYDSYHDAARKNNYDGDNYASLIRNVCKGILGSLHGEYFRDLDANGKIISRPIKNPHGRISIVGIKIDEPEKEIYFNSISEASKILSIDRSSLTKCVQGSSRYTHIGNYVFRELDLHGNIIEKTNITVNDVIIEFEKRNPVINGERHTISEWCKIYNIKVATVNARIRKGWGSIKAITTPVKRSDV